LKLETTAAKDACAVGGVREFEEELVEQGTEIGGSAANSAEVAR